MEELSELGHHLLNEFRVLEELDLINFLSQYKTYGYETEQEMINAGLQLLRQQMREEATDHLPGMTVDLSALEPPSGLANK